MKKLRIANGKASYHVGNREIFEGSHLFSELRTIREDGLRGVIREQLQEPLEVYAVFSYGHHFPLYVYRNGTWYGNKDKYSPTTSKQAGQARPYNAAVIVPKNTKELQALCNVDYLLRGI